MSEGKCNDARSHGKSWFETQTLLHVGDSFRTLLGLFLCFVPEESGRPSHDKNSIGSQRSGLQVHQFRAAVLIVEMHTNIATTAIAADPNPDLPFLVSFLTSLLFFICKEFLVFWGRFPFLRSARTRGLKSKTRVPKHAFSKHSVAFITL